ncbi:AI-2E family transporter [Leptodesmis sp.]|uniref:AI-2E family transporter n=1 Tax=Leptodesmis sp. TaxID=3100501 RepID=UPI004053543F
MLTELIPLTTTFFYAPATIFPIQFSYVALNNSTLLRFILLFIGGWFTFLFINFFYDTIAIFSVAGVLATLLNYPVVWLSRYLPRWLAITLTFLGAIAIVLALVAFVGLQVVNQGQALLSQLKDPLSQQTASPLRDLLSQTDVNNIITTLKNGLTSGLGLVKGVFSSLFVRSNRSTITGNHSRIKNFDPAGSRCVVKNSGAGRRVESLNTAIQYKRIRRVSWCLSHH